MESKNEKYITAFTLSRMFYASVFKRLLFGFVVALLFGFEVAIVLADIDKKMSN